MVNKDLSGITSPSEEKHSSVSEDGVCGYGGLFDSGNGFHSMQALNYQNSATGSNKNANY